MKKGCLIPWFILTVFIMALSPGFAGEYPPARKGDTIDDFHGTQVADPYRWLEDPDSDETMTWVEAQNELTAAFVNTPERGKIKKRYTELYNHVKYTIPRKEGDRYFYEKNDGLQAQYVLYMQEELGGKPEVVIDPNMLSEDGTIALGYYSFSRDASLIAYGLPEKGSDWQNIHVRNIDTGEDYSEVLRRTRGVLPAWKHDNSGFYYDRYPDPATVKPEEETYYNKVYWHTLGTPQSDDKLIYEQPEDYTLGHSVQMTEDGKYLIIYVWRGTSRENGIYYMEVNGDGEIVHLLDDFDAQYRFLHNIEGTFYFSTDFDAPHGKIISIDITAPKKENRRDIVAEQEDALSQAIMVNNQFAVVYMHDASDLLKIYNLDGTFDREIKMPAIGAIPTITGSPDDTEMFIEFVSFLYPYSYYRYDFETEELSLYFRSEVDFDASAFETKQIFFESRDGTRIPMFLTHKKNLVLDGNNPTLLYGYGGFQVNMTPFFSTSRAMWMENGGVFASAVTRGGIEYGEDWHQEAMLGGRQRVYEDFIGAAEWLIENKYTNSKKLVIQGASGGGLLVAACMVQRPDLFGAVLCEVPLTDMLRYHRLGPGHWWIGEYGNAEADPEHFEFLYAYSPYHNVREETVYPPTMITTADTDDRVVPAHAKKFAAELQAKDGGENPLLIRVETKAGHGAGKPTQKIIEEIADEYAFLFKVFNMKFKGPQ